MTGWGQTGPLSQAAGHDINYIALTGALNAIGTSDSGPVPPLNLLGDFGGGSLYLVMGILAGLLDAQKTGIGQVVDAAIVDGTASIMSFMHSCIAVGFWEDKRQSNMLDGAAHYYGVYQCACDGFISIGSIEPQFYRLLLEKLEIPESEMGLETQMDKARWPELKARVAKKIAEKTRDQWCEIMEGSDICFAPVLSAAEAVEHPHNVARNAYIERQGIVHPAPAPRFSKSTCELGVAPVEIGANTRELLASIGYSSDDVKRLVDNGDATAVVS
jgi:alpha-methylacyl-CoA racemase